MFTNKLYSSLEPSNLPGVIYLLKCNTWLTTIFRKLAYLMLQRSKSTNEMKDIIHECIFVFLDFALQGQSLCPNQTG